jgi:3-dehydroquinate synthase class II
MHTGSQVLAVDAQGRSRTVIVGRVKIETRPLLLVEVEVAGQRHSVLLQNSETVCLAASQDGNGIRDAVAVPDLKVGNTLLLNLPTGIQSQELVVER